MSTARIAQRTERLLYSASGAHATIPRRRPTRVYRKGLLVLLWVGRFGLAHGAVSYESDPHAWMPPRLSDLQSTNAPVLPPPPPQHPSKAALEAIKSDRPVDSPTWDAPRKRSIATLGGKGEIEQATLDERMEQARINLIFRDVDDLLRRRENDQAVARLRAALESPVNESALFQIHHRLGAVLFRMQDYVQAAHHMEQALALQPYNAAIASNLAAAQMTLGELDTALATLSEIQTSLITNRQLLFSIEFNLACLYSMKGLQEEALAHLMNAAEKDPPSALASLGDPQLDAIRNDLRFRDLQGTIEAMIKRPTPTP